MEDFLYPNEKQKLVSSFLEIAVGQTSATARQFLQATSWKLEEAIQLFFVGNEGGAMTSSACFPPEETSLPPIDQSASGVINDATKDIAGLDGVRPPLRVKRETLYDDAMLFGTTRHPQQGSSVAAFGNFEGKNRNPAVWSSGQGGPSTTKSSDNKLAALYQPPFELMHQGPFETAKFDAADADKWLVANLQSNTEFSSHMLNRDTWGNEAVAETIKTNFIFWQVYDDTSEGKKVCTYYKIESVPVILIIDPLTGQKMRSWSGMVHPDRFLEDLLAFMDGGPKNHHSLLSNNRPREIIQKHIQKAQVETNEEDEGLQQALTASMANMKHSDGSDSGDADGVLANDEESSSTKKSMYPALPEEPKVERNLLCRVCVRLPDGRRLQRNFLRTDPIQLLWSFCSIQLGNSETRPFRLTHSIPGASKPLEYDSGLTFEDSRLSNAMISVTWDQ